MLMGTAGQVCYFSGPQSQHPVYTAVVDPYIAHIAMQASLWQSASHRLHGHPTGCTPPTPWVPSCTPPPSAHRPASSHWHNGTCSCQPSLTQHVAHTGQHSSRWLAVVMRALPNDGFTYLPLQLPAPTNTKVASSKFVKSSKAVAECPQSKLPEFAFIGRSNAGKSSLINCLTNNQKLAKVSKEPGMTKLINHFLINDNWYLVDLPGYGFAKTASKASRTEWLDFTKDFFINRDALAHVLLLVDSSLPPQPVDVECANWLAECEVPFAIVFTKLDNKKKEGPSPAQNIRAFKTLLSKDFEELPWCFETSSKSGAGKVELLGYLSSVRQLHTASV